MEMETRQDENDEKQKENEKDEKNNINHNISSFLTRNLVLFQHRRGNLKMKLGQNLI